jgi:hypothetical protein
VVVRKGAFERLAAEMMPEPERFSVNLFGEPGTEARIAAPESGPEPTSASPDGTTKGDAVLTGAALLDGLGPAAGMWARWEAVDRSVFQAVAHMSHSAVNNFGDLMKVVDVKGYAVQTAGFLSKLVGHMGEWKVQEHLMSSGIGVSMPFTSNEPGLDMWLDGHAVNVKNYADVGLAAHEHFMAHPDIPIIVPADAANIPADALHFDPSHGMDVSALDHSDHLVIVDHALSHAETVGHAQGAIDTLGDAGPHMHVPWVTLAVSSFREGRLLFEGSTDLARAAKNIAVDTAAVGGGGFLGAKAGAAVGSLIAPGLGTLIGGLVGGIGGAIVGRSAANAIKRAPLDEAKAALQSAREHYKEAEGAAMAHAETSWQTAEREEQKRLAEEMSTVVREGETSLAALRDATAKAARLSPGDAGRLLDTAEEVLARLKERAGRRASPSFVWPLRWVAKWFAPQADEEARVVAADSQAWMAQASALKGEFTGSQEATNRVFDLVMAVPGGVDAAKAFVARAVEIRKQAYGQAAAITQKLVGLVVGLRKAAVERLRARWKRIEDEIREMLSEPKAALEAAVQKLKRELGAAGIKQT